MLCVIWVKGKKIIYNNLSLESIHTERKRNFSLMFFAFTFVGYEWILNCKLLLWGSFDDDDDKKIGCMATNGTIHTRRQRQITV